MTAPAITGHRGKLRVIDGGTAPVVRIENTDPATRPLMTAALAVVEAAGGRVTLQPRNADARKAAGSTATPVEAACVLRAPARDAGPALPRTALSATHILSVPPFLCDRPAATDCLIVGVPDGADWPDSSDGSALAGRSLKAAHLFARRRLTYLTHEAAPERRYERAIVNALQRLTHDATWATLETLCLDAGAARLAGEPAALEMVVCPAPQARLLTAVAAAAAGTAGLSPVMIQAPGVVPVFTARAIAGTPGQDPSGLIRAAAAMLAHLGQTDTAKRIVDAMLCAVEEGNHTADLYHHAPYSRALGTEDFAQAVIARLGRTPQRLSPAVFGGEHGPVERAVADARAHLRLVRGAADA